MRPSVEIRYEDGADRHPSRCTAERRHILLPRNLLSSKTFQADGSDRILLPVIRRWLGLFQPDPVSSVRSPSRPHGSLPYSRAARLLCRRDLQTARRIATETPASAFMEMAV